MMDMRPAILSAATIWSIAVPAAAQDNQRTLERFAGDHPDCFRRQTSVDALRCEPSEFDLPQTVATATRLHRTRVIDRRGRVRWIRDMDLVFAGPPRAMPPPPSAPDDQSGVTRAEGDVLWFASLDTLRSRPLQSLDRWGGVIVTDWFSEAANPNERFKVVVYVGDQRGDQRIVTAEAVTVDVMRQQLQSGAWTDVPDALNALSVTLRERQILDEIRARALALRLEAPPPSSQDQPAPPATPAPEQ